MELGTIRQFEWDQVPEEAVTDKLRRKVITGEKVMVAHIRLDQGCVVPRHSHEAEQLSFMFTGALKFIIAGETHIVRPGQLLVIPPWVEHEAVALEDTYEMDIFSPIRHDWLDRTDAYFHRPPAEPQGFVNPAGWSNPARLVPWFDVPVEKVTDYIDRAFESGQNATIADLRLRKGCVVPTHDHESEQLTWVRRGLLRLELEKETHDLTVGSVLRIPSGLPHRAIALEDCEVTDVFGPRREDWIQRTDAYMRQGNR